jgi:predicted nucleic acid-binding protein
MRTVFADTFFFLALLDSREQRHSDAAAAWRDAGLQLVTTEWVLTEFGDAYSDPRDRPDFIAVYRSLVNDPRVTIVQANHQLFARGMKLYEKRLDKKWSVTDCISFAVMEDRQIREALTGDRDFDQAGFIALLK